MGRENKTYLIQSKISFKKEAQIAVFKNELKPTKNN